MRMPLLSRELRPGAGWWVASDDRTCQAWVTRVMVKQICPDVPAPTIETPADGPLTRYETKAVREGWGRQYWSFVRR